MRNSDLQHEFNMCILVDADIETFHDWLIQFLRHKSLRCQKAIRLWYGC